MITTGAICIKTLLMENKKLQTLKIGSNQISNEGLAAICEGLLHNAYLTELWMSDCGLSVEGIITACNWICSFVHTICKLTE